MRWSARAGAAASGPAAVRRALSGWACVGRGQGGAVGVGRVCVCVWGSRPGYSLSFAAAAAAAAAAAVAAAAMVVLVVAAAAGTLPTTSSEPLGRAGPGSGPVYAWRLADTLQLWTRFCRCAVMGATLDAWKMYMC